MAVAKYAPVSWRRMSDAVQKVRQCLLRTADALERANIPYAVAGGNAVAAWVSRVDDDHRPTAPLLPGGEGRDEGEPQ